MAASPPTKLSLADLLIREDLQAEPREAFLELLHELAAARNLDGMERVCEVMLRQFKDDPEALAVLARVRLQRGATEEAIAMLETALLRVPDDLAMLQTLASAYEACGDRCRAAELVAEIARLHRRSRLHVPGSGKTVRDEAEPLSAPSIILTLEAATAPSLVPKDAVNDSSQPSFFLDDRTPASAPKIVI